MWCSLAILFAVAQYRALLGAYVALISCLRSFSSRVESVLDISETTLSKESLRLSYYN